MGRSQELSRAMTQLGGEHVNWISGRLNRKTRLQELQHVIAYLVLPEGLAQLSFPLLFFWLLLLLLQTTACDPYQKMKRLQNLLHNSRQKKGDKGYIFHSKIIKGKWYKLIPCWMNIFCVRCFFWWCWYNPGTPTGLLLKCGCVASPNYLLEMTAEVMSQEHYGAWLFGC